MKYNILARQTNSATVDGYGIWETVGTWENVNSPEDAIFFWMDEQKYTYEFEQTGPASYRFNNNEYDVMAIQEQRKEQRNEF